MGGRLTFQRDVGLARPRETELSSQIRCAIMSDPVSSAARAASSAGRTMQKDKHAFNSRHPRSQCELPNPCLDPAPPPRSGPRLSADPAALPSTGVSPARATPGRPSAASGWRWGKGGEKEAGRWGRGAGGIVCRVNWVGRMGGPVGWFGGTIIQPERVTKERAPKSQKRSARQAIAFLLCIDFSNSESLILIY